MYCRSAGGRLPLLDPRALLSLDQVPGTRTDERLPAIAGGEEAGLVNDSDADDPIWLYGRAYTVRTIDYHSQRWVHLDEDGVQVASSAVPDPTDGVWQHWIAAWLRHQLTKVAECHICHEIRYLVPATSIELMRHLEWANLRACPRCWMQVRQALETGSMVSERVHRRVLAGRMVMQGHDLVPDPTRDRFASRPDGRSGTVALTPLQLVAEVGARGRPVRWGWLHDGEGSLYEVSLVMEGVPHRSLLRCRWDPSATRWLVEQGPVSWVRNRVALSVAAGQLMAPDSEGGRENSIQQV